ncbi:MAG: hypothetical protein KBT28_06660 [Bacteroidales bacterium]|nr:hypothetical protein [Candidatus Colimorpha merdihippi]
MKKQYIAPRIKTVRFQVELGYSATVSNNSLLDGAVFNFRDNDNNSTNRNGKYGDYSANPDGTFNFFGE